MTCARSHEVEAARDGRIADTRSLAAHVDGCAACRTRAEQLEAIARAVRARPVARDDELAARRARHRLVEAFDAELRAPRSRARWALACGAAAALSLAVVWFLLARSSGDREAPPEVVTIADLGAKWTRVDDGGKTRVTLDDGRLAIRVDHRLGASRLVVVVPDGEIDDLGTAFDVSVRDGRVAMVSVHEGVVLLRRQGRSPTVIEAGRTWTAEPDPVSTRAAIAEPVLSQLPGSVVVTPLPASSKRNVPPAPARAASGLAVDALDRELARAIAALDANDYALATRTLRAIIDHGDDARAEDAAYLLVVTSQRSGDAAATREAAREYLRRFPHGFRRTTVQPLAD